MSNTVVELGDGIRLTRVLYTDALVPPEIMGLTVDDIEGVAWRTVNEYEDFQPRVGVAAWVIETSGRRVVVDPVQAADAVIRADTASEQFHQDAFGDVLANAGFARDTIDAVIMTHIEGLGMVSSHEPDGSWTPYFANATIHVGAANRKYFEALLPPDRSSEPSNESWSTLFATGCTAQYEPGDEIVPGVRAATTDAHCEGHSVLHLGSRSETNGGPAATMLGHLAISPLHLSTGLCPQQHYQPEIAWSTLHECADDGRLLIGPLWPSPGCGRWDGARFVPGP